MKSAIFLQYFATATINEELLQNYDTRDPPLNAGNNAMYKIDLIINYRDNIIR